MKNNIPSPCELNCILQEILVHGEGLAWNTGRNNHIREVTSVSTTTESPLC